MFELTSATRATITSVTPRAEKHGDEDAPAISFGVKIAAPNTILELIEAGMTRVFYMPAAEEEEQPEFDATRVVHLPRLQAHSIENVSLSTKLEGWAVTLDYGLDESAIVFGGCKVDNFSLALLEGGTVELRFRVGTSDVDATSGGRLMMLVKAEVSLKIAAPKPGSGPLKQADLIDASKDGDAPKVAWPFPKAAAADAPDEPAPKVVDVLPMGKPRTKRGRDATRAFLDAHAPQGEGAAS